MVFNNMFNFAKLTPALFSDSIVDGVQDPKTSRINLVQINTRIIDCHKNWNILPFKEAIKIKEKKLILNQFKCADGITTVLN